jgi:hypothetical protein
MFELNRQPDMSFGVPYTPPAYVPKEIELTREPVMDVPLDLITDRTPIVAPDGRGEAPRPPTASIARPVGDIAIGEDISTDNSVPTMETEPPAAVSAANEHRDHLPVDDQDTAAQAAAESSEPTGSSSPDAKEAPPRLLDRAKNTVTRWLGLDQPAAHAQPDAEHRPEPSDRVNSPRDTVVSDKGEADSNDFVAFSVSRRSLDSFASDYWESLLREGYDLKGVEFDGDFALAAEYMAAFDEGIQYVTNRLNERKAGLVWPEIVVVFDEAILDYMGTCALADASSRRIYIDNNILAEASRFVGPDTPTEKYLGDGKIGFVGSFRNFFRLVGVEEAHHIAYFQHRGPAPRPAREVTGVAYDATEPEWQALRWQGMAARHMNMPLATQYVLEERLADAKVFRRAQRAPKEQAS